MPKRANSGVSDSTPGDEGERGAGRSWGRKSYHIISDVYLREGVDKNIGVSCP